MMDMYKKIKKQNGEAFAQTLRNYHNGLLEIPDIDNIVRHAGRDAVPLLPYLMSLLSVNDDTPQPSMEQDPFVLLDRAGYSAFYADTLEKQNSIQKYFAKGELLCTFNDNVRHKKYHIIHAVRKNVDDIKRKDFKGKEMREDAYGTSVISIQMLKDGGFISIKNRYNHTVSACDNTFNSNPDNIIEGLSASLKKRFHVDFLKAGNTLLPESFVLIKEQVFKYRHEFRNIYYGDQSWAKDGVIYTADKSRGDALFGEFLFDNKNKVLTFVASEEPFDFFALDFNLDYGGNRGLYVKNGNLMLGADVLIGAQNSEIKSICLPKLTSMTGHSLMRVCALTDFKATALTSMGDQCLVMADNLKHFEANALKKMGDNCLESAKSLEHFEAKSLRSRGKGSLECSPLRIRFKASARCLRNRILPRKPVASSLHPIP